MQSRYTNLDLRLKTLHFRLFFPIFVLGFIKWNRVSHAPLCAPKHQKHPYQMKDRIRQLMLDKAMSQKSFAAELCIAEATLSGIFNGRTRPTNQTVSAIHECFPEVNVMWLMFGEGDMYTSQAPSADAPDAPQESDDNGEEAPEQFSSMNAPQAVFDAPAMHQDRAAFGEHAMPGSHPSAHISPAQVMQPQVQYIEKYIDKPQRKITEIRIFFDDGTYETFTP